MLRRVLASELPAREPEEAEVGEEPPEITPADEIVTIPELDEDQPDGTQT